MPTSPASKPLSSHPAFPAAVAVWFAALLGGGTFVLPAAIFESAAVATGLSEIVPAAQPPLGDTARLVVSLAAAAIGALLGLFVAWQVCRSATVAAPATGLDPVEEYEPLDTAGAASETGERTAWQVWREHMADADSLAEPDPVDKLESEADDNWAVEEDAILLADADHAGDDEYMDAIRQGPVFDEDAEQEPMPTAPAEDDPQRAEADRLVAGLARMRRDGKDAGYDPAPAEAPLPQFAPEPEADDDFDPAFLETEHLAETVSDNSPEPEPETGPEPEPDPEPSESPSFDHLGLPDLVARLELALEARRRDGAENAPGDEVVAFLRREVDRADAEADGEADPQDMLRAALDKLDQAGRPA